MAITTLVLIVTIAFVSKAICNLDPSNSNSGFSPSQDVNLRMGDLKLTPQQEYAIKKKLVISSGKSTNNAAYAAGTGVVNTWKNAIVPYVIDCSLKNMPRALKAIKDAMAEWESKTCIRFVPRNGHEEYLTIFRNTHCWSNVGNTGKTMLSLGDGCDYSHVMVHEFGHAIGFWHEQNRPDRDTYVQVMWKNIPDWVKDAFDIVKDVDSLGVKYDYESIMHYPWSAFSSNGKDTMKPRQRTKVRPYEYLSKLDVLQVSRLYNCPSTRGRRHADDIENENIQSRQRRSTGCKDGHQSCSGWAEHGQCKTSVFVRDTCKKSCNPACSVATTSPPTACIDGHQSCPGWANHGQCTTSVFVKDTCKKSCNPACSAATTSPPTGCMDGHQSCPGWSKHGQCKTSIFVRDTCKKSCNPACLVATTSPPIGCIDGHKSCPGWAKHGQCKTSVFVRDTCKNSCDPTCSAATTSPPTACRDLNPQCTHWANTGRCTTDVYVISNCQKSCKNPNCGKMTTQAPITAAPVFTRRPEVTGGQCRDRKSNCAKLASQCTSDSVRDACRVTCGLCVPPKPCKDIDFKKCTAWKMYCTTSKTVIRDCPITCNTCPKDIKKVKKSGTKLGTGILCLDKHKRCPEYAKKGECNKYNSMAYRDCLKTCPNSHCDKSPVKVPGSCSKPLGLSMYSPNPLPDSAFSSNSVMPVTAWSASASNARLHMVDDLDNKRIGAWCANSKLDKNAYVQVDLGRQRRVSSIATQGRDRYFERVSKFKVSYSNNSKAAFKFIQSNGKDMVFDGNCDHFTPILNKFPTTIYARYVRVQPIESNYPCMRMELYGC